MGEYLHQVKGPARGIYQMEPATIAWVLSEVETRWSPLAQAIDALAPTKLVRGSVEGALHYATALARMHYWLVPEALPAEATLEALWPYYKKHYNSELGAATLDQWARNFRRYVRV
jgi:hypothetical protein